MCIQYENWGCEFIDEPHYKPPEKKFKKYYWLPVALLQKFSLQDKNRARVIARAISILETGLKEPGILVVGQNSCYLKDGNHRLQAAIDLGWEYFPVDIVMKDHTLNRGVNLNLLVNELLKREAIVRFK